MLKKEFLLKRVNKSISNIHPQKPKFIYKGHTRLNSKTPITKYHYNTNCNKTVSSPILTHYHKSSNSDYINPQTVNSVLPNQKKLLKDTQLLLQTNESQKDKQSLFPKNVPQFKPNKRSMNSRDSKEDYRLEYVMNVLNIEFYLSVFQENQITFGDLFLLTKDDFIEMNIPIGPRNRLLSFQTEYKSFGGNHTIKAVEEFCNSNSKFNHRFSSGICQTESEVNMLHHKENTLSCTDYNANANDDGDGDNCYLNKFNTIQNDKSMNNSKTSINRKRTSEKRGDWIGDAIIPLRHKKNKTIDLKSGSLNRNNKEYSHQLDKENYNGGDSPKQEDPGRKRTELNFLKTQKTALQREASIKKLSQIKSQLKNLLHECNKSINEKQLVRISILY